MPGPKKTTKKRITKARFDPNYILSFQLYCNRLLESAAIAYATNPGQVRCVLKAFAECAKALEKCEEAGVSGGGGGPKCPPGTVNQNGRCVPVY
jgi:hypothetical protein